MPLSYADFDELQDKREQIIEALKNGAMRVSAVGEHLGLKKATLDYHVLKLIGCGLIEEKYEGKAAYIGLTAKCREMLRKEPANVKRILQENGRKRKIKPEVKLALLSVMFILILGTGLFLGSSLHQAPTVTHPITEVFSLPDKCWRQACGNDTIYYPIIINFGLFTNDFSLPSQALGNVSSVYSNLPKTLAPRTLLILNLTASHDYGIAESQRHVYWYTAAKVYDSNGQVIGQMIWNPVTSSQGYTCVAETDYASSCGQGFMVNSDYNNIGAFIVLNRPLTYDEHVTIVLYYQNVVYGAWEGIVH